MTFVWWKKGRALKNPILVRQNDETILFWVFFELGDNLVKVSNIVRKKEDIKMLDLNRKMCPWTALELDPARIQKVCW